MLVQGFLDELCHVCNRHSSPTSGSTGGVGGERKIPRSDIIGLASIVQSHLSEIVDALCMLSAVHYVKLQVRLRISNTYQRLFCTCI